eukprot:335402-Pyramimonas_sp.AAC.1
MTFEAFHEDTASRPGGPRSSEDHRRLLRRPSPSRFPLLLAARRRGEDEARTRRRWVMPRRGPGIGRSDLLVAFRWRVRRRGRGRPQRSPTGRRGA